MPGSVSEYTESGEPYVLELASPLWGEPLAGREWFTAFDAALAEMGLQRAEGVPCLWTFQGEHSDVRLLTIVDDFMISETEGHHEISDAIITALAQRFNLTHERDPTHFAGMRLARNRSTRALTVSMPQKVRECLMHLDPDEKLRQGGRSTAPVSQGRMRALADTLEIARTASGKLSADQKRIQVAVGHFKYLERVMPAIALPTHRLASVMIAAPPEANAVVDDQGLDVVAAWEQPSV